MNALIFGTVYQLFNVLIWILILRILLSWFPQVDWYKQPFKFIADVAEPILEPFRRLIPPISGLDFSPIVAFLVLGMLQKVLVAILGKILF